MAITHLFDRLFVNQLFTTGEQGETIFAPYGISGRVYLVPPEREGEVRSGVRRLTLIAFLASLAVAVVLPRLIETATGTEIPLPWFAGGSVVAVVVMVGLIIRSLSRLTRGLQPAPPRA